MKQRVYVVSLLSNGERWHSFITGSLHSAKWRLAASYGITELVNKGNSFEILRSPSDHSQTAVISDKILLD